MDPKVFLALTLLLHAPIVLGCVNFRATFHPGYYVLVDPWPLQVSLVDRGVQVCTYDGLPNDGSLYSFNCDSGYAGTLDPSADGGQGSVNYNPPWGNYNFGTSYTPLVDYYSGDDPGSFSADWGC